MGESMSTANEALKLLNKVWDYFIGTKTREEMSLDEEISYWAHQSDLALLAHDGNAYSLALDRLQFATDRRDAQRRATVHPVHPEVKRDVADQGNRPNIQE